MEQHRICSAERAEKQAAGSALDRIALDDPGRRASTFNSNAKPPTVTHHVTQTRAKAARGVRWGCSRIS